MATGTICYFHSSRCLGKIELDNPGDLRHYGFMDNCGDVMITRESGINWDFEDYGEGHKVVFDVIRGSKGLIAVNIRSGYK